MSVRKDLGVDNIDNCVGYALSKNRRCRNPIPFASKEQACEIFKRMSENGIPPEQLTDDHLDEDVFEELAELLLCSLHYADQKDSLITGWKQRALTRQREPGVREMRASETTVETITTMVENVSLTTRYTILERFTSSTGVHEEEASIGTLESDAFDTSRPSTASSSGRQSTTSHDRYPRSKDSHYSYRSNRIRQQLHNARFSEGKSSSERRSTSPTYNPTPHDSYDNEQPKPPGKLETFCPICLDSFKNTQNISRCRGCVEKFHGDCITIWLQQRVDKDMSATCPCW